MVNRCQKHPTILTTVCVSCFADEVGSREATIAAQAATIERLTKALLSVKGEMEHCMCEVGGYPQPKYPKCMVCTINEALAGQPEVGNG